MNSDSERFPLGAPVNRPPPATPQPIAGRPNWYRDAQGHEFYREQYQPAAAGNAPANGKPAA